MEAAALSDEKFTAWSKGCVLYCHITSKVKDAPHAALPGEKDVAGFPTFLVLDAAGEVLVRHDGERSPDGFAKTVARAQEIVERRKKAAGGDVEARIALLLQRVRLKQRTLEEAMKELDSLKLADARLKELTFVVSFELGALTPDDAWTQLKALEVAADQRKELEARINNLAVMEACKAAARDVKERVAAGRKFLAMKKDGRIPTGNLEFPAFWRCILAYAEDAVDPAVYEEGLGILEEKYGGKPSAKSSFDAMKETLKRLKEAKGKTERKEY